MKRILEGTEEQFKKLERLSLFMDWLPKIREEVSVDTIWQIDDVQLKWECTDEQALEVLKGALENEATMNQVWLAIDIHAEFNNLKLRKGE